MNLLSLLSRNRYTATLAVLAGAFFVSSCEGCFLGPLCFSDLCTDESGTFFGPNGESSVKFERNLGQAKADVDFIAYAGGQTLSVNSAGMTVELRGKKGQAASRLHATLIGAKPSSPEGLELQTERTNYLIGNDRDKWITGVPNFERVQFKGVYPGIDMVYYGHGTSIEHDFVVAPGADPAQIRMNFEGADSIQQTADGALQLKMGAAELQWMKPVVYQSVNGRRKLIEARYTVDSDHTVRFDTGVYDPKRPLTIDPVITYATYSGGNDSESAARVAVDASGNTYITGGTGDANYLTSVGAFKGTNDPAGNGDALIVKLSADGKTVLYTTHIGGASTDIGLGIALDAAGDIYITGLTNSTDYPVTTGAFETKSPRPSDNNYGNCFVTKLNNSGTAAIYSSYFAGSTADMCTGIAVDGTGNAYITGATASKNIPTAAATQPALHAGSDAFSMDAFVAKISPDGSKLLYSTYVGGSKQDAGFAIAVDSAGNAYVTGGTTSSDFPITTGAFQTTFGGSGGQTISQFSTGDAFVMKLDPTGKTIYSTFLGGSKDDLGIGIAIDSAGNAFISGSTMSTNFPLVKAFQTANKGSGGEANLIAGDGFVAKLNPQGNALIYSSLIGGSKDDRASAIGVDQSGNAFITGNTLSTDFPVTADASQPTYSGEVANMPFKTGDAFFAQIGPTGTLVYASYLGGSGSDWGAGIAIDAQNNVIVSGGTSSSNFKTTTGSAQARFGGMSSDLLPAGDAFVVKFAGAPVVVVPPPPTVSISSIVNAASYVGGGVAPGEIVTLVGSGIGPDTLQTYVVQNGQFTTKVAGTTIFFDTTPAAILYVSAKQTAVVVPYSVDGSAQVKVTAQVNGVTSAAFTVPVVGSLPGLFSADSSGSGPGAILNQDYSYNNAQTPAARGSYVALYGTGEGQTSPRGIDGLIAATILPKPVLPVTVTIGTKTLDSLPYAGAAPGALAGLFQINAQIPCDAPLGNVPVIVKIGDKQSVSGLTVAVRAQTASETVCPAP
jgi:uncharacterized protein (TIGR03437 family)